MNGALAIAFLLILIVWGVIGVKIFTNDYDFQIWAYIAAGCWAVMLACLIYRVVTNRCPHCGKIRWSRGKFCSWCGREIEK